MKCNKSGVAKVSCILRHRGVQLKLAYSWARPAILVAGKGRGGMFLFLLLLHFHSCSYFFPNRLFHLLYYLFYLFSPFLWETTQNDQKTPTQSNVTTGNKMRERGEISRISTILDNFHGSNNISTVKCGYSIYFTSILQI